MVVTTIYYINQGKTSGEHNFVIWKLLTEKRDCFAKGSRKNLGSSGIKFEVEGEGGSTGADTYIPLQKSGTFFQDPFRLLSMESTC